MAEIWAEIQPHLWEILGSIGMIVAIILKGGKSLTEEEKKQQKYEKAHKRSVKAEKELHKRYEEEAAAEKELKK